MMADQFGTPLKDMKCSFLTHTNIPMLISILEYEFCNELYMYIDLNNEKVVFVSFLFL